MRRCIWSSRARPTGAFGITGLGEWEGGDAECDHLEVRYSREWIHNDTGKVVNNNPVRVPPKDGTCKRCGAVQQAEGIGLEPTLGEWVENIVAVMREVRRVLRDDGTVWLNLGDAYAGSGKGVSRNERKDGDMQNTNKGSLHLPPDHSDLPPKNLMGQPWRVAFALQDDGWILRSPIVWHKPNAMPESATDRPTNAYEMIFLLSKQGRYFYDAEAIRERGAADSARLSKTGKHGGVRGYYREKGGHDSGAAIFSGITEWRNAASKRPQRLDLPHARPPGRALCDFPRRAPPSLHPGGHQRARRLWGVWRAVG